MPSGCLPSPDNSWNNEILSKVPIVLIKFGGVNQTLKILISRENPNKSRFCETFNTPDVSQKKMKKY